MSGKLILQMSLLFLSPLGSKIRISALNLSMMSVDLASASRCNSDKPREPNPKPVTSFDRSVLEKEGRGLIMLKRQWKSRLHFVVSHWL